MNYIITFLILFITWVIWSGVFDVWHLSLGVISCVLVTHMSHDLLFGHEKLSSRNVTIAIRFTKYLPWLFYQIILSNVHIARLALHPRMHERIDPHIIHFKTKLRKDMSLVTFANSITLTPGTVTIRISEGSFFVHAIDMFVAESLPGDMEKKIGHIFMED